MSVAAFYRRVIAELAAVGIEVAINLRAERGGRPDPLSRRRRRHAAYDARRGARRSGARWCRSTACSAIFRTGFLGKASPVHFFWGGFDLAVTRFSGRPAPLHPGGIPGLPDAVTREAYSHEVSSAGFWPGNDAYPQAAFYSYAYPSPAGFARRRVEPDGRRLVDGRWASGCCPTRRCAAPPIPTPPLLRFLAVDLPRRRRPRRAGTRRSSARSACPAGRDEV